jgi:hypothetical protein
MFIYSVRASTLKFFLVIVLTLSVLFGILFVGGSAGTVLAIGEGIDFDGIKTNEDRVKFIEGFGISVVSQPEETEEFRIPSEFDRIITEYNQIQLKQGLDLTKYKGKTVTRYTYKVMNYDANNGEASVNLIIYKDRIVACDLSKSDEGNFVLPLLNNKSK